jgi:DNA-directed RNA polymerase sigma subunit (sigma70/sigma32)
MKNIPDDELVKMYVRETAVPPIPKHEEAELFRQLGSSDKWNEQQENAARKVIEANLALVVSIAGKYLSSGVPLLDLIEDGNVGLMDAIRSFAKMPVGEFRAHAAARIEDSIARGKRGK